MLVEKMPLRWTWGAALALFVLAAATGSLLRFGMLYGLPSGLHLYHLRHAHSHLMYFGWVTPALMALMLTSVPAATGRQHSRSSGGILAVIFVAALVAYVSFLMVGYQPVAVGDASLPLATIAAGLNVIAWYGFILTYWRATRGAARSMALRLWDASLVFLVLASLGAWGLAFTTAAGVDIAVLSLAFTHLFLDLFADGWFLLALLGLALVIFPEASSRRGAGIGENLLVAGLPLTFLLSLPTGALPPAVRLLAGLSGVAAATGLLALLYAIAGAMRARRDRVQQWTWRAALFFLCLKAAAFLVTSLPAGAAWSLRMGLRVSYLHWFLLGGITIGLLPVARATWGAHAAAFQRLLLAAIALLILSLLPMTRLWPSALGGRWTLVFAAWSSLGPVIVMLSVLLNFLVKQEGPRLKWAPARLSSSS